MSIELMGRFWWRDFDADVATLDQEKFPGSGKNLAWTMLALSDAADDTGFCWPAVKTIASKARLSTRAVQLALAQAVALGIVRRRLRNDSSSQYVFNIDQIPHAERPKRSKERGPIDHFEEPEPDLFGTGAPDAPLPRRKPRHPMNPMHPPHESGALPHESHAPRTVNEPSLESSITAMSDSDIADEFVSRWNSLAVEVDRFERITRFGDKRKTSLLARIDEYVPNRDPEKIGALLDRVIGTVAGSRFLRGEVKSFKADPAWMLTPTYFPKLEEIGYVQDARADYVAPPSGRSGSHVEAGQRARDILRAGGGTPRRSARELAGMPPRGASGFDR